MGEEEKGLVALNWSAKGGTELVAMKRRPGQLGTPVIGVEHGIAQELKGRAVILVGARLGEYIDDAAGKAAILRVVPIVLNAEFLHAVRLSQHVSRIP